MKRAPNVYLKARVYRYKGQQNTTKSILHCYVYLFFTDTFQ